MPIELVVHKIAAGVVRNQISAAALMSEMILTGVHRDHMQPADEAVVVLQLVDMQKYLDIDLLCDVLGIVPVMHDRAGNSVDYPAGFHIKLLKCLLIIMLGALRQCRQFGIVYQCSASSQFRVILIIAHIFRECNRNFDGILTML